MKKAFDQTVRDIKRGVNKKVLKVPSIEQKVLDATSNEAWGPHGTHLADIAQASRNYHEYQMIMSVVWKRLNDTGKNWRHVFKALTVLEYLVASGSERVIEDIREHAYQISTLSTFQYIDSTGRDQGSNVRKKSLSLVALVNDKERIQELREKAAASRDKFHNMPGGPGDDHYEGRYGSRDEDRNGYGEREWGDDKYGRDGGRYGEDQYGRDGDKDDEYRGRSRSVDGDYGPRSRSSDRDRERAFEDDGHHSSRGSNARVEDGSQDGSQLELKLSGKNLEPPPSYEDAVGQHHSPVGSKRDGETSTPFASKLSSPQVNSNHQETSVSSKSAAPAAATPLPPVTSNTENEGFDLFDPRGSFPAAPLPASGGVEMDLFGSLSDAFSSNAVALVPPTSATTEAHPPTNSNPYLTFMAAPPAAGVSSQPFDDPFGDGPFRAVPSTDGFSAQPPTSAYTTSLEPPAPTSNVGFGDTFDPTIDILADILPPPVPSQTAFQTQPSQLSTQTAFPSQPSQASPQTGFPEQPNQTAFSSNFPTPFGQPTSPTFPSQGGQYVPQHGFQPQSDQSMPQTGFPPKGDQSVPPPAFPPQVGQSAPQPGLSPQGSQSMPQPAFAPQGGQSMSQPAFPVQGGQSTPQPAFPPQSGQSVPQPAFPPQGGQSMPQPAFPPQGGHSMPQPAFPVQGGQSQRGQSVPQPGLPPPGGQSMPQPAFLVQGGQPMPQPAFLVQGGQPMPQPAFPPQSGQSVPQPGLPPQTAFPVQGGHQSSFPAQGGEYVSQPGFPTQGGQSMLKPGFPAQGGQSLLPPGFPAQGDQSLLQPGIAPQVGQSASLDGFSSQLDTVSQAGFPPSNGQPAQPTNFHGGFRPQGSSAPLPSLSQVTPTPAPQYNTSNFYQQQPQLQSNSSLASSQPALTASTGALAIVSQQPAKDKFETKSTVWADTLNRGLVNLNISGSKTNPLSDIGIDFEAINRKEKRMEKPSKIPVTSNVTMGKAMGSCSGIGRAGAGALRPAGNPMVGPGMGITMGARPGFGAGYGGVNQNQPMGMNNMPQNMGIGMNIGQGFQMQQPPAGFPPGATMPGNYNPMLGGNAGYGQRPYGGYR